MAPSMPTSQHSFSIAMDIDPEPELEVFYVSRNGGVEQRNSWDHLEDLFGDLGSSLKDASLTVEEVSKEFEKVQFNTTFNTTFPAPAGGSYTISTAGASFGIADITDA